MAIEFIWHGLEETMQALKTMPEDMKGEAKHLIEGRGNTTVAVIRAAYPYKSGKLIAGVSMTMRDKGQLGVSARVRSSARYAKIFDEGMAARHTEGGASRGPMPAAHTFVRNMIAQRRALFAVDLADLMRRFQLVPHVRS